VKLLFDENVSPKLVEMVAKEFPGCAHVRDIGLRGGERTRKSGTLPANRAT